MKSSEIILSITSWRGRVYSKDLTRNLFRFITEQKTQYKYRVILVLSEEEFPQKERELPSELLLFTRLPQFELLWTYKNTKALKKLDPVREKYPDAIIITTDDDIVLDQHCIENIMNAYDGTTIISHGIHYDGFGFSLPLVWGVRCFPPKSLFPLNSSDFTTYFNNMQDDEWNGIRIVMAKTPVKALWNLMQSETAGEQAVAFRKEYGKFDMQTALQKWFDDHPSEASIFNQNIQFYKDERIYQ